MPVNVRVALISEDGSILAQDMDLFDPSDSDGPNAVARASARLRQAWRRVTNEERAEFGEAMASITRLSANPQEGMLGGEELGREAAETWRLAGVFGRVNCPHGCKQVAADAECPHGYPSLAKRMGVKF